MESEFSFYFYKFEVSRVHVGYRKTKVQNEFFSICLEEVMEKNDEWEIVKKGIVYRRW